MEKGWWGFVTWQGSWSFGRWSGRAPHGRGRVHGRPLRPLHLGRHPAGRADGHVPPHHHHLGLRGHRPLAQLERRIGPGQEPQGEVDARFFAIVTDLVGAPGELVDEQGVIAWRGRSTAWGATGWNRDAAAYTPLRLPGQYDDAETGFYYNYQRHLDGVLCGDRSLVCVWGGVRGVGLFRTGCGRSRSR